MVSLTKRPLDLFLVIHFCLFSVIAVLIDILPLFSGHGPMTDEKLDKVLWPPKPVVEAARWYMNTYDPFWRENPYWVDIMGAVSPFVYFPFYLCAIYAFIKEKEWIRTWAIVYSSMLLYSMVPILAEELWGPFAAPNRAVMFLAYSAYLYVPFLLFVRVFGQPVFGKTAHKKQN